jgi:tripartite-type tricarboxylate transporter receptor subunit TctC
MAGQTFLRNSLGLDRFRRSRGLMLDEKGKTMMESQEYKLNRVVIALLGMFLIGLFPAKGHSQNDFYKGKTVTLVATTAPGGTGDLRVKAMLPFLKKHIPGNPTIVIEYMDGGGGRKGANHIFNSVQPDGLTIGAASGAIVGLAIMREKGVSYDIDKFIYLGTPESENHYVIYTRKELGLDNLEKLKGHPDIRIGAQSVGHVSYVAGRLFAYFLDMKQPKFIAGYSSREVDIALVSGELDARANNATSVLRRNPDWFEKKLMNFHAIMEVPKCDKHARLGHLPEIESFAKNEKEKKLISLWRAFRGVGSPYILPPGTPKDRVEILSKAMNATFKDPEFGPYFKKIVADDASPLGAAELRKVVAEIPRDAETIELLRTFAGPGPLPPR